MNDHPEKPTRVPSKSTLGIVLALTMQFGSIVWFASSLSTRMDKVEQAQTALQERYEREVIPRADLGDRLDHIESELGAIMDRLMRQGNTLRSLTQ